MRYSREQVDCARNADLADFLRNRGEKIERSGSEWRWQRHDSVTLKGNIWCQHSMQRGGDAIDFVRTFYGQNFIGAVAALLNGENGTAIKQAEAQKIQRQKAKFELPQLSENINQAIIYLVKNRFIDREIVRFFADRKAICEDAEYHNVIFVGFDENDNPRQACKRSTNPDGKIYRYTLKGSDPNYGFSYSGTNDKIYVFESAVDLL